MRRNCSGHAGNFSGLLLLGLFNSATGEGTTPTPFLCDGDTTYSLGLLVPKTGLVPYAVTGVCVFLHELGYTRMVLKSDGEPSIAALVTAVQKEWVGDSKNVQAQLIPRRSPVDDHAANGAAEVMVHSLEGLTRTSKIALEEAPWGLGFFNFSDSAVAGETSELPLKPVCRAIKRQTTF